MVAFDLGSGDRRAGWKERVVKSCSGALEGGRIISAFVGS